MFLFFYFFSFLFFFIFSFIFISWRLITLQYWSGFCHTLTWISHGCTCVPHPEPPSHLPPHPIPLGHPSAPALSTYLKCETDRQFRLDAWDKGMFLNGWIICVICLFILLQNIWRGVISFSFLAIICFSECKSYST